MENCNICGTPNVKLIPEPDSVTYSCPRCGKVKCSSEFQRLISGILSKDQIGNACGWIRENEGYVLQNQDVEFLKNIPTPTVEKRVDKLLLYLVKKYPRPPQQIGINDPAKRDEYIGVSWSTTFDEFCYLVGQYMTEFTGYFRKLAVGIYQIAPAGWERVAKLQAPNSESNIAFVAMRFNDKMKEIFSKTIRPVIIDCCFEPLIIFERNHINKIDDEIIAGIRKSRYIVADFTEQNQGAYYEAGFARGLGLQVISTCDKAEVDSGKIHFDTRQYRTILWERDKLDLFKKELQDCIEANIGIGKNKSKR